MRKFGNIVRYTAKELDELRQKGESRTDWARVDAMTEEELEASIAADPDDFAGGIAVYAARDFDGIVLSDLGAEKWTQCRIMRSVFATLFKDASLTIEQCVRLALDRVADLEKIYRGKLQQLGDMSSLDEPILIEMTLDDVRSWEAASGTRLAAE
jgi:hypothetical protein